MGWFFETKAWEWIFSGVGVVLLAWMVKWLWGRRKRRLSQATTSERIKPHATGDDIRIQAGGDVSVAKDHGKSIQVKNSQIGVIGDHAEVKGGIRFKDQK